LAKWYVLFLRVSEDHVNGSAHSTFRGIAKTDGRHCYVLTFQKLGFFYAGAAVLVDKSGFLSADLMQDARWPVFSEIGIFLDDARAHWLPGSSCGKSNRIDCGTMNPYMSLSLVGLILLQMKIEGFACLYFQVD
jgi:hypothetical protein